VAAPSAPLNSAPRIERGAAELLDVKLLRESPDKVRKGLKGRGGPWADALEDVIGVDSKWRQATAEVNALRQTRNRASEEIGKVKDKVMREAKVEEVRGLKDKLQGLEVQLKELDARRDVLLLELPNLPDDSVPFGAGPNENVERRRWGEPPAFAFEAKDHGTLGAALGIIDFERGVKLAGEGFYAMVGAGARLERALIQFFLDEATAKGYLEIVPPFLVTEETATGTGHLPKNADDMYLVERDRMALIPTAEVPLTSFYRGDVILTEQLPLKLCAYTPCFRREAGRNTDTKGLVRVHQFNKVEMLKLSTPEAAWGELESLTRDAEALLQKLGLAYRVVELCTGDIGFAAAKTYDVEVWLPSQGGYREISSCSCFTDFQARRAGLKYRDKDGQVGKFLYTLNGSGLAVGRTVVAILENFQRDDGSIEIPKALVGYMGGAAEIRGR
jgi:seryl-tRNA synthetase